MGFTSSIAEIFKAVRRQLTRPGVRIGGTAAYPRVEIHSLVEDAPAAKDNSVRSITCTIECVSDEKVADVVELATANIEKLFGATGMTAEEFRVIGVVPGQIRMFDEQEALDQNKVIYRLLQDIVVWVEKKQI